MTVARSSRRVALALSAALVLAACTDEQAPAFAVATVSAGEVVQTIAAAAELQPAGAVTVSAPAAGEIAELFVSDGDVVAAGDPLLRLESDALESQLEQTQAAVDAAASLAEVAGAAGGGLDLAPTLGAFRAQLDAVFPPLLTSLQDQLSTVEAALAAVATPGEITIALPDLAPPDLALPPGVELPDLALPPGVELPPDLALPDPELPDLGLPDQIVVQPPGLDTGELEASLAQARATLAEAQRGYRDASGQLREAERSLASQTQAAVSGQQAAIEQQRAQAELALTAAQERIEGLTIVAPAAGVVELAPAAGAAAAGGLDPGLAGLGGLAGSSLGDLAGGDLGGLLDGGGTSSVSVAGPIAEGVTVGAGQALLTIYDLSSFTARVLVDEIDIVEVEVGQPALVLVDAFPNAELDGAVTRVALTPQRQAAGGSLFEVTVALRRIPGDVQLRIGLTASAEIEVRRIEGDTVVPTSALLRRGGDEVVYVVRDGVGVQTAVRVTAIGDDTAAVEGDLTIGEQVVTTGVELLEDGDAVVLEP